MTKLFSEKFKQKLKIATYEPLNKGWSSDKKYIIETTKGEKLLLRVADLAEQNRKKAEYLMAERVYNLGVPTPKPLDFGLCEDGRNVYSLFGWLVGEDAAAVLPSISEIEQFVFGTKAGEILQKMHTLPAPKNVESWAVWFWQKVQDRIDFYHANPIKSDNGDVIVRHLQENKNLLNNRPQTFNHGDFNVSNMIITPNKQIGVIDFNYDNKDHGDPWWEFDPPMHGWGSEPLPHFYTGFIKGYFGGEPPSEFFEIFSFYQAYDALAALCDTLIGEQGEPADGKRHMENILRWFDNMRNSVPMWYL